MIMVFLLGPQDRPSSCADCSKWNEAQRPFLIYGNTYYVGPHGLTSLLITSPTGHVLIDGALSESVPLIVSNIRQLGFKVEDIRLIVNSHPHYDHAGGISELQKLSGARVVASDWTADVMRKGAVPRDDPQFGLIRGIKAVSKVETLKDGETLLAGSVAITAHFTPGHTPGGTSWTWRACEQSRCLNFVYADSLSPVSAAGFKFSRSKEAIAGFERSYAFLKSTPCDILVTPHPDNSNFWERFDQRRTKPDAFVNPDACRRLAAAAEEQLQQRLEAEKKP